MDKKIRVAAVDYLNTKPLIWGFENGLMKEGIELKLEYPAKIAQDLLSDEIDVGLVPVAILPLLKEYYIISEYCIGSNGEVASVCLFSEVPIHEIKKVYLDYQSRTSVALLKILLTKFWKLSPQLLEAGIGYETKISGEVAALVIGDRALSIRKDIAYVYDLGQAWTQMTGLPFVYATWVANKSLPASFIEAFNKSTGAGFEHLPEIVKKHPFTDYDLHEYYTKNIDYAFDDAKKEALAVFLKLISSE